MDTDKGPCKLALQRIIGLFVFANLHLSREAGRELLVSLLLLVTPADSCQLGGGLAVSAGCATAAAMFARLILLNWTNDVCKYIKLPLLIPGN